MEDDDDEGEDIIEYHGVSVLLARVGVVALGLIQTG